MLLIQKVQIPFENTSQNLLTLTDTMILLTGKGTNSTFLKSGFEKT